MEVKIKKIRKKAITPTNGSNKSAGYDLYACCEETIIIEPFSTVKIGTRLAIKPPEGYFGAIFARSGLATKNGLVVCQGTGVIDSDYRGEWLIPIHNDTNEQQTVYPEERITQVIFTDFLVSEFIEVKDLTITERGCGGFGSTGK